MKKVIYTLTGVLLTTTLMMGCGSKTADTQNTQNTQSASTDDASNKQKDIQKADLEGEVTSISGNKITLKVIKTPEAPTGATDGTPPTGDASNDSNKSKSDNSTDGQSPKSPENMKVEYTGETKDITIGDDVQIKTMNMGQQGAESKDLTANDIKVGDVLQVTYSDKDKETISAIDVRSAANQNKNTTVK